MPQITYIDTEKPVREASPTRWRALLRAVVRWRVPILAFMALYRLIGLSFSEMQQWDEAIYALRTQCVLRFGAVWDQSGEMLSGLYYSVHPPLYVWLSTASVLLFGDALWVYRLPSALAAAVLVPLIYRFARAALPPGRALVTAGLFAFAPLPTFFSRQGQLDLLLTLCMIAALLFAMRAIQDGRTGHAVLAGLALGAALMTKFGFALIVPAAVALSGMVLAPHIRRRALRTAIVMTLVSLPLWLPWTWWMTTVHGDGDPLWFFSSSLPLGATWSGIEGSVKDTGGLFYLNQLTVHLSVFFPFAAVFLWDALFVRRRIECTLPAAYVLLTLIVLWMMGSSFAVYLIPMLPMLFFAGVRGVAIVRRRTRFTVLAVSVVAVLTLVWSLSHDWRVAVKDLLRMVTGTPFPSGALMPLLLLGGAGLLGLLLVWLLYRHGRIRAWLSLPSMMTAVALLAVVTMWDIWFVDPDVHRDGAAHAAAAARASDAEHVMLVGNGDNPQLTWYLGGADIGWNLEEHLRYERYEPHALGADAIRERAAQYDARGRVLMIIERDEITQGMYRRPEDVTPQGVTIRLTTPRYYVAAGEEVHIP